MNLKKVGITQRVEVETSYNERRDCLDQRWTNLAEALDIVLLPLTNKVSTIDSYLDTLDLDAIILSGGNDLQNIPGAINISPERDRFEHAIIKYAIGKNITLIGICRGMQILNIFFGGRLSKVAQHVACDHLIKVKPSSLLYSENKFEVNSYHKFGIFMQDLGSGLDVVAEALDGSIEAFKHNQHPFFGLMWHPEREKLFSKRDLKIFKNFLHIKDINDESNNIGCRTRSSLATSY